MKLMKILCSFLICCCSLSTWAQERVHQVFTPNENVNKIVLDIAQNDKNVEIRKTQGTRLIVEATVSLSIKNDALLKYLVENGRYNLVETAADGNTVYTLSNKKNNNVILVKGEECKEDVFYTIYVPEAIGNVTIKSDTGTASVE